MSGGGSSPAKERSGSSSTAGKSTRLLSVLCLSLSLSSLSPSFSSFFKKKNVLKTTRYVFVTQVYTILLTKQQGTPVSHAVF
jgi:hypothetical protein